MDGVCATATVRCFYLGCCLYAVCAVAQLVYVQAHPRLQVSPGCGFVSNGVVGVVFTCRFLLVPQFSFSCLCYCCWHAQLCIPVCIDAPACLPLLHTAWRWAASDRSHACAASACFVCMAAGIMPCGVTAACMDLLCTLHVLPVAMHGFTGWCAMSSSCGHCRLGAPAP